MDWPLLMGGTSLRFTLDQGCTRDSDLIGRALRLNRSWARGRWANHRIEFAVVRWGKCFTHVSSDDLSINQESAVIPALVR